METGRTEEGPHGRPSSNGAGQDSRGGFREEAGTVWDLEMQSLWRSGDKEPGMPPTFQCGDKVVIKVTKGNTGGGAG